MGSSYSNRQFQEASDVVIYISAGHRGCTQALCLLKEGVSGMQRATVIYETSDLTPASFRTSFSAKQSNKLTIFVLIMTARGTSQLASLDFTIPAFSSEHQQKKAIRISVDEFATR